jgi:enoyl-CoA hydratase/3-hydroxyacyl-CoA dehydrogenase
LLDYAGLDIVYHSALYVAERLPSEYESPAWLKQKIAAGDLRKKSRKAIYDWSKGRSDIDIARAKEDFDATDLIAIQVNEATKLLEERVATTADDIDKAMIHAVRGAFGPFKFARQIGYDTLAARWRRAR